MVKQIDHARLQAWVEGLVAAASRVRHPGQGGSLRLRPPATGRRLAAGLRPLRPPPKKYFQPVAESPGAVHAGARTPTSRWWTTQPFILLGVHPYDLAAIRQMDAVFSADNEDVHYLTRRRNATIIASDMQNASPNSFASCMGTATAAEGFDILLTKLGDTYVVDARTEKGEALMEGSGGGARGDAATLARREQFWAEAQKKFVGHRLNCSPEELPGLLADSYEHPIWKERAAQCFSCGSCTMVCPTCYCFNVSDQMAWDLQHGAARPHLGLLPARRVRGGGRRAQLPAQTGGALPSPLLSQGQVPVGSPAPHRLRRVRPLHRRLSRRRLRIPSKSTTPCWRIDRWLCISARAVAPVLDLRSRIRHPRARGAMTEFERFFEIRLDSGKELGPPARPVRGDHRARHRRGAHLRVLFSRSERLLRARGAQGGPGDRGACTI